MENLESLTVIIAIFIVIRLLSFARSNAKAKRVGKEGEKELFRILTSCKSRGDYAIGNLYIPTSDESITELDGLFINIRGVFVIEAKAYRGTIYGSERNHDWTKAMMTGNGVDKRTFYNPIMQNSGHVKAIRNLLGAHSLPIYNVVAFSDSADLSNIDVKSKDVFVVNYKDIPTLLADPRLPECLRKEDINLLSKKLRKYRKVKASVKRKHIKTIKKLYEKE